MKTKELNRLIKIAKKESKNSILAWIKGYLYRKNEEWENFQIKK